MPTVKINDLTVYYERHGQGQPLLFIHGLGSSTRDWQLQVAHFSQYYQPVLYDVRGHGQSDKPAGPYNMTMFASDAAGLISTLALAPVHVVGISMGGMIALQLAIDAPHLIKSLTVVNAGPDLIPRTFKQRFKVWQRFLIVRLLGMRKMGQVLGGRLFPKPEHEELRRLFEERWAENDPRAYMETGRALVGWSVIDQLGDIDIPTLVLAADQDYTPVSEKESFVSLMPQAELVVINDCRHALPVERPNSFNRALKAFLDSLE
jgi:pimeloyl-ACP methyl ester carboxylesterase